jgi:hypothetical protein
MSICKHLAEYQYKPQERNAAKVRGETQYFTGRVCKNGHIALRNTASGSCSTCSKAAQKISKAISFANNPNKYKIRYKANAENLREKAAIYRGNNIEKAKESQKQSKLKFRAKHTAYENNRRALKENATPVWLTKEHKDLISDYYIISKKLKDLSGSELQVDHIVPLKSDIVCGLHVPWNLCVIGRSENAKKYNSITELAYISKQQHCLISGSALPWNW